MGDFNYDIKEYNNQINTQTKGAFSTLFSMKEKDTENTDANNPDKKNPKESDDFKKKFTNLFVVKLDTKVGDEFLKKASNLKST